jgi:hypothetical protein
MNLDFNHLYSAGIPMWFILSALLTVVVHLAFSAAVFNDASRLRKGDEGPEFVGPVLWCLAVLAGGLLAACRRARLVLKRGQSFEK